MQVVADRFLVRADGAALDLATGEPVVLKIGVGGGESEQARWTARCQQFHELAHPQMAHLVDFGAVGVSQRFEAWACRSASLQRADGAIASVQCLLRRCALTAGSTSGWSVFARDGVHVALPADDAGYEDRAASSEVEAPDRLEQLAIATIPRRPHAALEELFATLAGPRPHVVVLWGPSGSGRTTTLRMAARMARVAGFVPVATHVLKTLPARVLSDRSLCVMDEEGDEGRWSALLGVALGAPRGHIVLKTSRVEAPGGRGLALEPVGQAALMAAVRPASQEERLRRQVERAASLARGLPGIFASTLWRGFRSNKDGSRSLTSARVARVAEEAAVYAVESDCRNVRGTVVRAWPDGRELTVLVREVDAARSLVAEGHAAPGVRQLRQAIGALCRRGHWEEAGRAGLHLASALLTRGLVRDAREVLSAVHEHATRATATAILVEAGILSGHAWIDSARLDQAEAVLSATLADAERVGERTMTARASLAMARCLFWRGNYRESAAYCARSAEADDGFVRLRAIVREAKANVGLRDPSSALARLRDAAALVQAEGAHEARAAMCCASAFVHLSVNDVDAAAADVRAALSAARQAHHPMRVMQARLVLGECERRAGRAGLATPFLRRVLRISRDRIPSLMRTRADLLAALCDRPEAAREQTARHADRTGLHGLELYGTGNRKPEASVAWSVDAVVHILQLCQRAENEAVVVRDVCTTVRRQLHASAVAVFVLKGATWRPIAGDGARIDGEVAARMLAPAVPIGPRPSDDRLEAGAAMVYGGTVIGGLVARWPVATPYDLSAASGVIAAAVAALAPIVSVVAADRAEPGDCAARTIIGQSAPMVALRAAIAAAASAPFAVLVGGESGSGKELVARALHRLSPRRDRAFCTLNCAALPEDLIEAELFGHARGAYTGAMAERPGVFEEAHGGTLFLDEVGELSARAQAKLLRVVQEGELRRLGENLSRRVDVRLVAATNRDLGRDVEEGRFRQDLLYRLDVIRIVVPPLCERREDVALLAEHFWREATARIGSHAVLAAATYAALAAYAWPGNVRELQNVLSALAVRAPKRGVVAPSALPSNLTIGRPADGGRLEQARRQFEERFVRQALARSGGRRSRAAAELGVTRQGLTKLMLRLGICDAG